MLWILNPWAKKIRDKQILGSRLRAKNKQYKREKPKETVRQEGDGDTDCSWHTWNDLRGFLKETGGSGNQSKNRDKHI